MAKWISIILLVEFRARGDYSQSNARWNLIKIKVNRRVEFTLCADAEIWWDWRQFCEVRMWRRMETSPNFVFYIVTTSPGGSQQNAAYLLRSGLGWLLTPQSMFRILNLTWTYLINSYRLVIQPEWHPRHRNSHWTWHVHRHQEKWELSCKQKLDSETTIVPWKKHVNRSNFQFSCETKLQ